MTDAQWMTYADAGVRLGLNAEAVRRRADRGNWARRPGNDGRTRILVPEDVRAAQAPPVRADASALVSALESHIATLKADIERLTAELAAERTARQAELAGERAARQTDQERAAVRLADQDQQLTAARVTAGRATAQRVELARRLAEIGVKQTAEPEPPRRSASGRAWGWFLRN